KPQGTDFQKLVWSSLITIPYGTTTTYGEIAKKVALKLGKSKMSAQAVGSAIAHNPICIVIPCHRVLGQKQKMVGFAAGIERKEWLLRHEGVLVS
ncbi:MAG: methylated-DNA--[protein]-cysteine S-methyltransferase, partial [Succinivibrio sp.]|nr:methylated-DNA--[protein]-cysteine S-methyltransferase [Succinivibrio sp.]